MLPHKQILLQTRSLHNSPDTIFKSNGWMYTYTNFTPTTPTPTPTFVFIVVFVVAAVGVVEIEY